MDNDHRASVAVREARQLRYILLKNAAWGQFSLLTILGLMIYFDVPLQWMLFVGFSLTMGTINQILSEMAQYLRSHLSFLEMWAIDADRILDRIDSRR